jgi:hypothetical protein
MTASEVRNWLGKYFLLTTVLLGGYILLFSGQYTALLRIDRQTGMDCFQIIVPTLLGQLTLIFRFFGSVDRIADEEIVPIPGWVVKWPPILLLGLIVATIVVMGLGNVQNGQPWSPLQDQFKTIVTFYVSVLNATTVFVVSRFFERAKPVPNSPQNPPQTPPDNQVIEHP